MGKAAKILANYVIQKGTVKEDEREIYEYGFTVAMETVLCIIVCFVASLVLHTVFEGILFFIVPVIFKYYAVGKISRLFNIYFTYGILFIGNGSL